MADRTHRTPFTSTASVALAYVPGSASGDRVVQFDSSKLTNTTRVPVEIREIRILARSIATDLAGSLPPPHVTFIEAKLGKHYITDGLVPMSVMSPYRYRVDNSIREDFDDTYALGADTSAFVTNRRIILPKPIILNPGVGFRFAAAIPTAILNEIFTVSFTVDLSVTIIGRFMAPSDPIPMAHDLPMISHVELRQVKRISLEDEIQNPLAVPITVHRFVGSRANIGTAGINGDATSMGTTIDLRFPDASPFTENPIDFKSVFGQMRVWPVNFMMDANKRITVRINQNTLEDDSAAQRIVYQIALFGTRSEIVQ